jgi:hypothetical protein
MPKTVADYLSPFLSGFRAWDRSRSPPPSLLADWNFTSVTTTTVYKCPICARTHANVTAALACCPLPSPEKTTVARDREISPDEARDLGILDTMLRKRVRIKNMDIDYDWLNDNCTGLYICKFPLDNGIVDCSRIAFELDEDYALFKLRFHGAQD